MRCEPYDGQDGQKVWLDHDEVELLIRETDGSEQRIAVELGVRCGLRAKEIVDVTPVDVVEHERSARVRVQHGKGDKYREVPIPSTLHSRIEALADIRTETTDTPIVNKSTRTLERWVSHASDRCRAETGDDNWRFLGPHDLRRTWGTQLVEAEVEPGMIMVWGGWEDWETFREHYLGAYSPEMERKQAAKVPWL